MSRSQSPVVQPEENKETLFNWGEACTKLLEGHKLTKASWGNEAIYLFMKANFLHIRNGDGTDHTLIVSSGDMVGTDYYIVV